jgi:hypothetical protein
MSREWYRFFLNIFTLVGGGNNQTSLDDLQLAPPFVPATAGGGSGTVTSVDVSGGTTGLTTSGGPITTSGTITLAGILNIANGGTGSATAAGAPFALKGANADITSLSGLTGPISSPTYVQFGSGSGTTLAAGRMWYDQTTGSLNFGMGNGNITQQVGEETFMYGKASAAITDSPLQIIYHTGTVGASGVITFAPTIAGITNVNDIIGVATESLALNDFGRITAFGVVRGITTNGTAFGETWADDDVIWYNPVTGNPTKVEPVAPNIKVQIGTVINAGSGGSGSFQVLLRPGSVLGGTDSNVQFGTLANNDLIAYDSTLGYWKNIPGSSYGTGTVTSVGLSLPAIFTVSGSPVTTAGTLTAALASQTANYFFAAPNGSAGAPTFRAIVAADVPTLNQNTTGTAANVTGIVAVANGGSGQATAQLAMNTFAGAVTSGSYLRGNGTNVVMDTIQAADVPTLNQNTTGTASNVTGIVAVANGGTGTATPALVAGTNVSITGTWPNQTINSSNPGGTVTSVAASVPSFLSISGSPITSSGTLAITYSGTALPILNGGTGQTTASAAFNALSPITTTGDLIIGNGANSATRLAIGANNYVLTSNGTTAVWAVASGSGATITNDTTTATNIYPLLAAATSGSLATAYTSDAKLLYKPSTGEFLSQQFNAGNGIYVNSKTVSTSYTIATGNSGMSAGPITIASGKTVTISSGSRWVVL